MKKNNTIEFIKDYGILLLVIVGPLLGFILLLIFKDDVSTTKKQVHWHAQISYDLCGDNTQLKDNGEHGPLHGHNDKKIHIEGIIDTINRIETLGKFFDAAKIPFSNSQIGKYTNGDKCEGSEIPGKVSVTVNGIENNKYRNIIVNDKDEVKIIFK